MKVHLPVVVVIVFVLSFDVIGAQYEKWGYLNRGCPPPKGCQDYKSMEAKCRMPTMFEHRGRRCRGCYIDICEYPILYFVLRHLLKYRVLEFSEGDTPGSFRIVPDRKKVRKLFSWTPRKRLRIKM